MSAISSQLSFRSARSWNFNPRVFNIMDSIYAIAFGLGLRTLVDAVSQDVKLTGSLIGLWEGVITLHFLKKMPKSSDPYIAYGVRLFIDFLITESIERLVLVLIWTAFGMVLADVTPAIWDELGLKRVWRHFRRDLYTIYDKIPTVAFFPPQRTVRFLPPRQREPEPEPEPSIIAPSIDTSQDTPITIIPPSSSAPSESLKHRVPGYYPGDYSDTDTDTRSRRSPRTEVDDAIVSDSEAVSSPSSDQVDIPDMEEEALIDVGVEEQEQMPQDTTPKQKSDIPLPPTPSDSAFRDIYRDDVLHAKPPRPDLSNIPDSGEDGGTSDGWEKIHVGELDEETESKPPTPPAKDRPVNGVNAPMSIQIPPFPPIIPLTNMDSLGANSFSDMDYSVLDSFTTPHVPSAVTDNRRESVPPPYTSHMDDFEEMYYNPPPKQATDADDHDNVNDNVKTDNNADDNDFAKLSSRQTGDTDINTGANPWDVPMSSDAIAQAQADATAKEEAAKKDAEDAAQRVRKEEEEEMIRKEEAAEAERIRKEEEQKRQEEEKAFKAEEARREKEAEMKRKAEIKKKEEDDDTLRKQRQAAERKKEEEEAAKRREEAEEKRKVEEKKKEEAAAKNEEAEQKRKAEEKKEAAAAAAEREEAEQKREAEEKKEAAAKIHEEAEQKRKDDEAEQKEKEEEDAAKKKEEEIAEQERKDEDADVLKKKEVKADQEANEDQEAAEHAHKETEETELKSEAKETEQADLAEQKTDSPGDQATQEKDDGDDSKTLRNVEISEAQPEQRSSEIDNTQHPTSQDSMEEESVISAATVDTPDQVKVRLERMMILRAQMVEVEKRLDELEGKGLDGNSPEMKAAEKSMRKLKRQAERRYAAGVELAKYLNGPFDNSAGISLEALSPQMAGTKIEEKLEQLLTPTTHSISFQLNFVSNFKKQKPVVRDTLAAYNLTKYVNINEQNKREYAIEISEENFSDWLVDYRASVLKRDSENAEEDDDGGWQRAY